MRHGIRQSVCPGVKQVEIKQIPILEESGVVLQGLQILRKRRAHHCEYERLMLEFKIPEIVRLAKEEPSIICTEFIEGVVGPLKRALTDAGLRVGVFTGDSKEANDMIYSSALEEFKAGGTDVLIGATKCMGTGIDGGV